MKRSQLTDPGECVGPDWYPASLSPRALPVPKGQHMRCIDVHFNVCFGVVGTNSGQGARCPRCDQLAFAAPCSTIQRWLPQGFASWLSSSAAEALWLSTGGVRKHVSMSRRVGFKMHRLAGTVSGHLCPRTSRAEGCRQPHHWCSSEWTVVWLIPTGK